jgi:hypothetical protein
MYRSREAGVKPPYDSTPKAPTAQSAASIGSYKRMNESGGRCCARLVGREAIGEALSDSGSLQLSLIR